jgi:hypothetical protein
MSKINHSWFLMSLNIIKVFLIYSEAYIFESTENDFNKQQLFLNISSL